MSQKSTSKGMASNEPSAPLQPCRCLPAPGDPITDEMLEGALRSSLRGKALEGSLGLLQRAATIATSWLDRQLAVMLLAMPAVAKVNRIFFSSVFSLGVHISARNMDDWACSLLNSATHSSRRPMD